MECGECKFFHKKNCYRWPPRVIVYDINRTDSVRPIVYDGDPACGEFTPKKGENNER